MDLNKICQERWERIDKALDDKIAEINKRTGISKDKLIKLNPIEFCANNRYSTEPMNEKWLNDLCEFVKTNKADDTYLIAPMDATEDTIKQILYKEHKSEKRERAKKYEVVDISPFMAKNFFRKNHRQSLPNISKRAVIKGLRKDNEIFAVMLYDKTQGAIRGTSRDMYELNRLSFRLGTSIMGGAGKLQKACEKSLAEMGEKKIFSFSNATINTGGVYRALGFEKIKLDASNPIVYLQNRETHARLVHLYPYTSLQSCARRGVIICHFSANIYWEKELPVIW